MNRPAASSLNPICCPGFICALLVLAVAAVYYPVSQYRFVDYDDPVYFFTNPHVLGGLNWTNFKWAFTSGEDANWHPLTWLSLMLDAQFFGKGAAAPHLTNVLLHMANSVLLFILFWRLTSKIWRSGALALLFAIHPLHVESVAWVAERKDVLSGFFFLLTLLCYARYARRSRAPSPVLERAPQVESSASAGSPSLSSLFYGLALLFFACGLMSKPMLVTLPFVLLLLDFWPLQRFNPSTVRRFGLLFVEKIPFLLLSAADSVVTFIVQQKGGAVTSLIGIPMEFRIENAFISYARYLGKIFWPVNLAVFYPDRVWPLISVAGAVVLFAALNVAAVILRRKFPFVFTGWFWFAGMLVPVIGIVQAGEQAMADRYVYLPLIGVLVVVIWGLGEACAVYQPPRRLAMVLAAILILFCGVRARSQVSVWKNDVTLFEHALMVTRNNYVASLNLGYWYSSKGRPADALNYYYQAWRMQPDDASALYDVGNALAKIGYWDDAIHAYRRALQITPNQPDIMDNLGFALAQTRQLAEATSCFQAVLKLKPNSSAAHNNLGTILFVQGKYQEAAQQYDAAVRLAPGNPRMAINLGDTLLRLGRTNDAVQCYQRALSVDPGNRAASAKLQSLGRLPVQ